MGIYEYTRMPFGIKNAPAHFQRMMDTVFQEEILEGWMGVYIDDIIICSDTWEDHVQYIDRVLPKCTPINLTISIKKCNFGQQELLALGYKVSELLALGHKVSGLCLEIDQNKVAAVLQNPVPTNIKEMQSFLVQLKDSEARYGATHTECLFLVWALEKLHYFLEGAVFEVYTDCTALKCLLNMKDTNRHILRWKIAIQEYRGNMDIIYKEGKSQTNLDGLSRWPLDNVKSNPAYEPEVVAKIPIHFMEIDRRKNFRFSEWAPRSGTPDSGNTESEGTEIPILGISSSELHNEFFSAVLKTYVKHKQCGILFQLLQQKYRSPELEFQLEEPWLRDYKDNKFFLIDGLLYHREKHTSALTVVDRDHICLILHKFHDCPYMGHISEDRTKERVASTAWWHRWE
ncbi:hypothetical protein O181_020675 [Austropuccinia psidii MF-1]|uniref:Reverse transcriptase domain-containing protein n=1 Tax=Austropuccinia psidii MF-1 TaxID=1389203 RepID=A0A9Q3CE81_9BASI|nr:hypothetical protein [Austropuccinia psidii MF-1]